MSPLPSDATRATDRPAALAAIGSTPIVRLARLAGPDAAEVWVKLEGANPTGSYKDRMALAMIEGAERSGRLAPGQTVVEYTGGSTGSSLAFVCAQKGYPARLVSSDAFAAAKLATMRAFGAELDLVPSPEGITPRLIPAMRARAAEVAAEIGGYQTDQFGNHDMVDGYRGLGEEILEQLDGHVDAWVSYVGTAGCFCGVSAALRERLPDVRRIAVEPAESAVLSGRAAGTHRIEGGGIGSVPPLLDVARDIDAVHAVPQDVAFAMAREAASTEGVFSGPSTGANLAAAIAVARELGPGKRVVTVAVDSGLKYLDGPLYGA
jgi:cysteine synthase A